VSVNSQTLVTLSFVFFYLIFVLSFNFQNPFGTRLGFNYLDLNLHSRIQFPMGSTSHLHTIILHTTCALASTFNLYIKFDALASTSNLYIKFLFNF
jgi:hypothetical protein